MQPDKWKDVRGQILDSFSDVEEEKYDLQDPEVGNVEVILFNGPLGKMKLEYITKPVILGKTTHGSRRIGSHTEVEYIYSNDEVTHRFKAFKWDDEADDWVEIETEKGTFSL